MPSFVGIQAARERIEPYGVTGTPLRRSAGLSRLVGTDIWVKHENHQPTGAFKVRGGINLISRLSPDDRGRGVVAASTGNHGLSVAHASDLFGVTARICVPVESNPVKVQAMRDLGGEVLFQGVDFDEARKYAAELAERHGYRYIHAANEPDLIEGVATHTLEILEEQPDIDVVIVPVGSGSGAAGACLAAKAMNPGVRVLAVQAELAPAAYRSWRENALVEDQTRTAAEGLATRVGFELPQRILREHLDDFILVSERELDSAVLAMIEETRTLVEAAGASPLAAAIKLKEQLRGSAVALICTGGNITLAQLASLLALT